jgi:hypothetical protein
MNSMPSILAVTLLTLILSVSLRAQQAAKPVPKEVSSLLAEFRKEFGKAKEPSDKALRTEASKNASALVAAGNADGAKEISSLVDDKIAGKAVTVNDAALANLFSRYDSAVVTAAKPVRDKFNSRVDALLKGSMSKDMNAVVALGEAKKVILGELRTFDSPIDPKVGASMVTNPARGKKVLSDLVEGKTWEFQSGGGEELISFDKRGNKVRCFRAWGNNSGAKEYTWSAEDDLIRVGTDTFELRFDMGGSFGELQSLTTNNRYRMVPSTKTIPVK